MWDENSKWIVILAGVVAILPLDAIGNFVGPGIGDHWEAGRYAMISARMASDLGFEVTVISDATAAHEREGYDGVLHSADDIHTISLVTLDGEFCKVRSTKEALEATA